MIEVPKTSRITEFVRASNLLGNPAVWPRVATMVRVSTAWKIIPFKYQVFWGHQLLQII